MAWRSEDQAADAGRDAARIATQVRRSLVDSALRQLIPAAPGRVFAHILFALMVADWADGWEVWIWAAICLALHGAEYATLFALRRWQQTERRAATVLGAVELALGLGWASAAVLLRHAGDPQPWLILFVFVLATTAPSCVVMASVPIAHRLYSIPPVVITTGAGALAEPSLRPLALGALVYSAMLVVFNNEAHATLTAAFQSQSRMEQLLERLGHEVRHDQLTGVLNRSVLTETAETARVRAHRHRHGFGILYLDLDRFKHVNDGLGHPAGDDLLRSVARRLETAAIGAGLVARVGGDEFIVLLDGLETPTEAAEFAGTVLEAIARPHHVAGHELAVSASIGLAWCEPGDARTTTEDLLTCADVAMYRAKEAGGCRVVPFDARIMGATEQRSATEWALRRALADGQLFCMAQRIVAGDGSVTGCELLARWRQPDGADTMPGNFIPLAEETGLVVDIGRWILREAAALLERWQQQPGLRDLRVSVNISGLHVRSTVVEDVRSALAGRSFPPSQLVIEITETHLMADLESSRAVLEALRGLGVCIALDDFGTGYSSLAYFAAIPADVIKADKSFVDQIVVEPSSRVLLQAISALSVTFDRTLVIEGIETFEQWRIASNLGGRLFQGFLFGRPESIGSFEAAVRRQAHQHTEVRALV
jgi:diguanylate cyclase (GGDEF)-like protein